MKLIGGEKVDVNNSIQFSLFRPIRDASSRGLTALKALIESSNGAARKKQHEKLSSNAEKKSKPRVSINDLISSYLSSVRAPPIMRKQPKIKPKECYANAEIWRNKK